MYKKIIIVKKHEREPIPKTRDIYENVYGKWIFSECSCKKSCGAPHFTSLNSMEIRYFYTKLHNGWHFDGTLTQALLVVNNKLKIANTQPNAIHCISCGGKLKDPGMGPTYKHCPKCEP